MLDRDPFSLTETGKRRIDHITGLHENVLWESVDVEPSHLPRFRPPDSGQHGLHTDAIWRKFAVEALAEG